MRETLRRAAVAGLSWPLGDDVSDAVLEAALYRAGRDEDWAPSLLEPDWAQVHRELKRKHMTLHRNLRPDERGLRWLRGLAMVDLEGTAQIAENYCHLASFS